MRATSDVVSFAHGSSSEEFDSPTNTPRAKTINNLERQILNEKLVFVNSDRKLIKKLDYPVNADSDSEVEEVFNEITRFMTLTSSTINKTVIFKSFYEQYKETHNEYPMNDDDFNETRNEYRINDDDFNASCLTNAQMMFAYKSDMSCSNGVCKFDMSLRGQHKFDTSLHGQHKYTVYRSYKFSISFLS
ncbi:hypothetical protein Tco_0153407 [Tanacetum coccineum]